MTHSSVEIVNESYPRGPFQAAIFDFDGTLSLLRQNWQAVMIPMMVEELRKTESGESSEELWRMVEDFVVRLTGRQTIYQMIRLADEVEKRGGQPLEPLQYKHRYHDRLWAEVGERVAAVRCGTAAAEEFSVPGSDSLLKALHDHGLTLYLASGTDLKYVEDELKVLQFDEYFSSRVYGALDDYQNFSKAMIIEKIIAETGVAGREIIGVGDGYVEIEEIKKVGGLAVGVASNEETREGVNPWKRTRLIEAGADLIVADYRQLAPLLSMLGVP